MKRTRMIRVSEDFAKWLDNMNDLDLSYNKLTEGIVKSWEKQKYEKKR